MKFFPTAETTDTETPRQAAAAKPANHKLWAPAVAAATILLTVLSYPNFQTAAFAYAFASLAIFWAYLRPGFRLYSITLLASNAIAWTLLLGWLHNVTIGGLLLLGPFMGLWSGLWYLAVWWTMPRMINRPATQRILAMFALAALWVLLEWLRTWLLGGFPWLPLAATQWQTNAVLQIAAYTGAAGVSFVLITFNIAFAAYAHRLLRETKRGLSRRSQEFLAALFLLLITLCVFFAEGTHVHARFNTPLGTFAFVQPAIPQTVKWDPTKSHGILQTLDQLTRQAAATKPDLILWPEASTPWALRGEPEMAEWARQLAATTNTPLLAGSIAIERKKNENDWFNAVFLVTPENGVSENYYAKQKLVPFGEYIPLRFALGWLTKFTDAGEGDFMSGNTPAPLPLPLQIENPLTPDKPPRQAAVGALICYEDIFPQLARQTVRQGADLLFVAINNGWFGEGSAAYQHAAHSVLRAVETRRPLLRVGNSGWSGWIDEFGSIRAVLTRTPDGEIRHTEPDRRAPGTVYFRGTQTIAVTADARWIGRQSFYVRHGDWFILLSAALVLAGYLTLRNPQNTPDKPPSP